jgi:hypothetical protein
LTEARIIGQTPACSTYPHKVGDKKDASLSSLPPGCPHGEWIAPGKIHYDLKKERGFEALENRVVIDWGRGALAWHQKTTNKVVAEVRPKGSGLTLFTDYLDFTLTYSELKSLFDAPDANSEWRARLSSVAGVYLILASRSGKQYVGSACGGDGIWGRWANYAATGHGGNVQLKQLMDADPSYPDQFTFSILQILSVTTTRDRVLRWEAHYKSKLGSPGRGPQGPGDRG